GPAVAKPRPPKRRRTGRWVAVAVALLIAGTVAGVLGVQHRLGARPKRPNVAAVTSSPSSVALACATLISRTTFSEVDTASVDGCDAACNASDAQACTALGRAASEGPTPIRDHARARAAFERACDLRDADGCQRAAALLRKGRGAPRDPRLAFTRSQ